MKNKVIKLSIISSAKPIAYYNQFISAQTFSDTQINIYWVDTGADTYVVDYSTDNLNWTNLYTGNNSTLSYNHTGLTVNTTYYYRVKGQKTGYADSPYSTASAKTLTFTPLWLYDYSGLVHATDNAWGTCSAGNITKLKSSIGSGPNLTSGGVNNHAVNQQDPRSPYVYGTTGSQGFYDAPSNITISGDFTIIFRFYCTLIPVFYRFISGVSSDNYLISFSNSTSLSFAINGTFYSRTWPITLTTDTQFDCVFQRTGSNFRIGQHDKIAGTTSWSATVTVSTADFIFSRFFATNVPGNWFNGEISRFGAVNSSLSDSQVDEFFNYGYSPNFTIPSDFVSGDTPGLTYSALSNYYYPNNVLNTGMDSNSWRKIVSIGDKTFANCTLPKGGTTYGQDVIHAYDHNTNQGAYIALPNYNTSTDAHETGSLFNAGNRLGRARMSPFYSVATNSELKISMSATNMNFNSFGTSPDLSGIAKISFGQEGYLSVIKRGNTFVMLSQEFTSFARWLVISVSYDYGRSWKDKIRISDSGASPDWWYPFLLDVGDNSTVYVVMMNFNTTKYRFCSMIKSTDLYTWTDMAGGNSKDVRGNNPITITQGKTNYLIGNDATALAGGSRLLDAHVDSGGNAYLLMTNGTEDGHLFITISNTGTVVSHALTYGGKTVEFNHFYDGAVWKTASGTYNVALFEVVGGNHFIDQFQTTDSGATWSYVQRLTSDTTNEHKAIAIDRNIDYIPYGCIASTRQVGATTNGNEWVRPIKQNGTYLF